MSSVDQSQKKNPHWLEFKSKHSKSNLSCMCFMGYINAGKSTLCELFESYISNNRNPNLTFEEKNKVKSFYLPNVISTNLFDAQTKVPTLYNISSNNKEFNNCDVLDVPTFALSPINETCKKLWSVLDSKIGLAYLMNTISEGSFVLFITESSIRGSADSLKILFTSFFEIFNDVNDDVVNGTALVISRCPSGFKLDKGIEKIEKMMEKWNEPKVTEWFQKIKEKNRILLFNKINAEENSEIEAKTLYSGLTKLKMIKIEEKYMNVFDNMNESLKNELKEYLDGMALGLSEIAKIAHEIPEEVITDEKNYQECKDSLSKKLLGFANRPENIEMPSVMDVVMVFIKMEEISKGENNGEIFLKLLAIFIEHKVLSEEDSLYPSLKERAEFYNIFWTKHNSIVQWDHQKVFKAIEQENRLKKLTKPHEVIRESFEQEKPKEFYESLIKMIEYLVDKKDLANHKLIDVWISSNSELAGLLRPSEALEKLIEMESNLKLWKKNELIGNLCGKIAEILFSIDKIGLGVKFVGKSGNPDKGIELMNEILKNKETVKKYKIETFKCYLELLQDLGLNEKLYRTCYKIANIFKSSTKEEKMMLKPFLLSQKKQSTGPSEDMVNSILEGKVEGFTNAEIEELRISAKEADTLVEQR